MKQQYLVMLEYTVMEYYKVEADNPDAAVETIMNLEPGEICREMIGLQVFEGHDPAPDADPVKETYL
jgi:hypothetical protein